MRTVRRLLAASCVALVASACAPSAGPDIVDGSPFVEAAPSEAVSGDASEGAAGADGATEGTDAGTGSDSDGGTGGRGGDGTDGDGADAGGGQGQPAQPPAEPAPQPAPQRLTPADEQGPVGTMGRAYLRGDRPNVLLEIDVQAGVALPDSVVNHLSAILARESNAEVRVQRGPATGTTRDVWSVAQLRAAAGESRDVRTSDQVAVLHLLVMDGAFEEEGVLGLAFDASTAAVFPDQWSDLASVLLSGQAIARAVTTHEVGHLLGLVGLAAPPTSQHEDAEHPGHTTDQDDVMYWAVETTLISSLSGVPDDFGPRTRADLASLRDG